MIRIPWRKPIGKSDRKSAPFRRRMRCAFQRSKGLNPKASRMSMFSARFRCSKGAMSEMPHARRKIDIRRKNGEDSSDVREMQREKTEAAWQKSPKPMPKIRIFRGIVFNKAKLLS